MPPAVIGCLSPTPTGQPACADEGLLHGEELPLLGNRLAHLQEYIEAVKTTQRQVASLEQQMHAAWPHWSLAPVVEGLMALRGVKLISAMTILAELGDISQFDSPRQLMAYLGLVHSEHSSGPSPRQGGITKAGNGHVRRILTESSWNYRFPARKTRDIEKRAEKTSEAFQATAWAAQKRLCGRYQHLLRAGKVKQQVTTVVGRELAGFIWAIACEVMGKHHGSRAGRGLSKGVHCAADSRNQDRYSNPESVSSSQGMRGR